MPHFPLTCSRAGPAQSPRGDALGGEDAAEGPAAAGRGEAGPAHARLPVTRSSESPGGSRPAGQTRSGHWGGPKRRPRPRRGLSEAPRGWLGCSRKDGPREPAVLHRPTDKLPSGRETLRRGWPLCAERIQTEGDESHYPTGVKVLLWLPRLSSLPAAVRLHQHLNCPAARPVSCYLLPNSSSGFSLVKTVVQVF